jgi:crotonobetainyl-CoA:carnitine CoA-transferase CaiB-like acyl-CoA transferase
VDSRSGKLPERKATAMTDAIGPLAGIRVVDLTIWMSGAIGSMLLGDLGAEVIKVEGPTGDPIRRYVPIGATASADAPTGVNYAYAQCNRNKRQVTLDLRDEADRERLYDLVRDADVFITSMQAQTLLSLGADEQSIKAVNPDVIYARAGGLGHTGPLADDRCQDMLGMAYGGLVFTVSPEPDEPFAPPGAINDVLTGTMTAFGVLAALMQRNQSGAGGSVYSSLLHTALWTQLVQFGTVANAPQLLLPAKSRRNPRSPGVNQYRCADGHWIAVAAVTAEAWALLVKALELDLVDAETNTELPYAAVLADAGTIRARLDDHFATQPVGHWLGILKAAGIWCSQAHTLPELVDDEQVAANGYLSTLDDGLETVTMPFILADYQPPTRAARTLGQDNTEVFGTG